MTTARPEAVKGAEGCEGTTDFTYANLSTFPGIRETTILSLPGLLPLSQSYCVYDREPLLCIRHASLTKTPVSQNAMSTLGEKRLAKK